MFEENNEKLSGKIKAFFVDMHTGKWTFFSCDDCLHCQCYESAGGAKIRKDPHDILRPTMMKILNFSDLFLHTLFTKDYEEMFKHCSRWE